MKYIKFTIIAALIIESILSFYSAHLSSLKAEYFRYALEVENTITYFEIYTDQSETFLIIAIFSTILAIVLSFTSNK